MDLLSTLFPLEEELFKVIGSYVQAFFICTRQVWFMSRQVCPDEDNIFLQIGRLIQKQAYSRERKEVHIEHLALDMIKRGEKTLVIAEVKKTSKAIEAARMQLAFYLYELKNMGIEAEGELLFPEERKKEILILTPEWEGKVEKVKQEILELINQPLPPSPHRGRYCSKCAYAEFCWA